MLLIIFFFMFGFSLEIAFDVDLEGDFPFTYILKIFSCIFICLNIFIKVNTEYFEYGICVKERTKIMINYAKNMLFLDFLTLSSLIMSFYEEDTVYYYKCLFFFTYFKIRKLYNNLKQQRKTSDFFEICLLLFRLICISHIIACIWHAIAYYNLIVVPSHWLDAYSYYDWQHRYIISLYWGITTLCTVGYGDITPKNSLEIGYCCIVMLIGTLIFGYSINSIGVLINRIEERGKELSEKMTIIDIFMNKGNIKEDLRIKVKNYLQYIWKTDDKNLEKAEQIIDTLPSNLREEIILESTGKLIKNALILKNNFSKELLNQIALDIKPIRYSPCDKIYKKNANEIKSLFIIKEGQIDLVYENKKKSEEKTIVLKQLKPGECFGELPFFTEFPTEESAISRSFSVVYRISRNYFMEKMKMFPDDYEKFVLIKDQILMNQNYSKLHSNCLACKSFTHRINDCPFICCFTNFKRYMTIQKHIYSKTQDRASFNRRKKRIFPFNSLFDRKKIMIEAELVCKNLILYEFTKKNTLHCQNNAGNQINKTNTLNSFDEEFEYNSNPLLNENELNNQSSSKEISSSKSLILETEKKIIESSADQSSYKLKALPLIDFSQNKINEISNSHIQELNQEKKRESFKEIIIDNSKVQKHIGSGDNMENNEFIFLNFDLMKDYKYYYKNGNVGLIVKGVQKKNNALRKKEKKINFLKISKY